ncbi:MAG TPA: hypothetical protein VH062_07250 [Polyangiaceae bacterium]|jgi:hypothetical protein|nr:hypothetical protein [Polyangiaceae bacterium]
MKTEWRKLGRPALVGFVVGLVVIGGLAALVPHSPGRAAVTR